MTINGKFFLVTYRGYISDGDGDPHDMNSHSVMTEREWNAFSKCLKKHGEEDIDGGVLDAEEITYQDYLDNCEKVEIPDANTREFLMKHCKDPADWSPRNIWEECKRFYED